MRAFATTVTILLLTGCASVPMSPEGGVIVRKERSAAIVQARKIDGLAILPNRCIEPARWWFTIRVAYEGRTVRVRQDVDEQTWNAFAVNDTFRSRQPACVGGVGKERR
jgi:hypothetical protein